jgi:hypothetical protein
LLRGVIDLCKSNAIFMAKREAVWIDEYSRGAGFANP